MSDAGYACGVAMRAGWRCLTVSAILLGIAVLPLAAAESGTFMQTDPEKAPDILSMKADERQTVWVVDRDRLYFWNGEKFEEPEVIRPEADEGGTMPARGSRTKKSESMKFGRHHHVAALYGGGKRGVYTTQGMPSGHNELYRLRDGKAEFVTTFRYEGQNTPAIYISENGTVFNWGSSFLAQLRPDGWMRSDAQLSVDQTQIFDLGSVVFFYYNNRLYRADSLEIVALTPPEWHAAQPGRNRIMGARWGETGAILIDNGKAELLAFDLMTCEVLPLEVNVKPVRSLYDCFNGADGSTYLLGGSKETKGYEFLKLTREGELQPLFSTELLPWDNSRRRSLPQSVLALSDREFMLGLPLNGVAYWYGGKMRHYNWRYGLAGGVRALVAVGGRIWAGIDQGVISFGTLEGEADIVLQVGDWEDYRLATFSRIWRDREGDLLMFRRDKTNQLSRWDGKEWSYQDVPFDSEQMVHGTFDNRGHLLVASSSYKHGGWDIGSDSVKRYEDLDKLLVGAVGEWASDFNQFMGSNGIVAEPPQRVWMVGYSNRGVLLESHRVDRFTAGGGIRMAASSYAHGVIFGAHKGDYYRYERGLMVRLQLPEENPYPFAGIAKENKLTEAEARWWSPPPKESIALMLGEAGFQPYEREQCLARKGELYPVMSYPEGDLLFFDIDSFEAVRSGKAPLQKPVELPRGAERLTAVSYGGAWLWTKEHIAPPLYLQDGWVRPLNLEGTPLQGKHVQWIERDRAGNLWFQTDHRLTRGEIYFFKLSQVKLVGEEIPESCDRELKLKLALETEKYAKRATPMWRFAGEEWTPGELGEPGEMKYTVRFPTNGTYRVELSALVVAAPVVEPVTFEVEVEVSLPETLRVGEEESVVVVDDPYWEPPLRCVAGDDGDLSVRWRKQGEEWQEQSDSGFCNLVNLEPGQYQVEFAAVEEGFWVDPTPLVIEVEYRPDYDRVIERRLEAILSGDKEVAQRAVDQLVKLGRAVAPKLRQRISNAEREAELLPLLKNAVQQFEAGGQGGVPQAETESIILRGIR